MRISFIPLLAAISMFGACATAPTTGSAFRAAQPAPARVCSPREIEEAVARLKTAWQQCFFGQSQLKVVPSGTGVVAYRTSNPFSIVEQREGEMTTLYLKFVPSSALGSAVLGSATFVLMADFQKTAECNAEVSARGWNEGWQRAAARTSIWLESPQSRGADVNCKE